MNDREAFSAAMAGMAASLPMFTRELTDRTLELYWQTLSDLTDEEFRGACMRVLREMKAFPTPSDLLERAPRARIDAEAEAARVFLAIARTPRHNPRSGSYWSEEDIGRRFGDAAVQAFSAAGGTMGFRAAFDPDKERFVRRDFVACYMRVAKADPRSTLPLIQAASGRQTEVTRLVGSVAKARSLPRQTMSPDEIAARKAAWRGVGDER